MKLLPKQVSWVKSYANKGSNDIMAKAAVDPNYHWTEHGLSTMDKLRKYLLKGGPFEPVGLTQIPGAEKMKSIIA